MATLTLTFDNLGEATALQRGTWTPPSELGRDRSVLVALPRLLVERGHEIAAHGWCHEPWAQLHPEQASELLRCVTAGEAAMSGDRRP